MYIHSQATRHTSIVNDRTARVGDCGVPYIGSIETTVVINCVWNTYNPFNSYERIFLNDKDFAFRLDEDIHM